MKKRILIRMKSGELFSSEWYNADENSPMLDNCKTKQDLDVFEKITTKHNIPKSEIDMWGVRSKTEKQIKTEEINNALTDLENCFKLKQIPSDETFLIAIEILKRELSK